MIEEYEEKLIPDHNTLLLKTALCMFMNVSLPKDFLSFLPLDTEVNKYILFGQLKHFKFRMQK